MTAGATGATGAGVGPAEPLLSARDVSVSFPVGALQEFREGVAVH